MLGKVFVAAEEDLQVEAVVEELGDDLLVVVRGGRAHVGAIGIAIPRPSLCDPAKTSATASVITMPGHKEDELAKQFSQRLASELGRTTIVIAGIHYDRLGPEGICRVSELAGNLLEQLLADLGHGA